MLFSERDQRTLLILECMSSLGRLVVGGRMAGGVLGELVSVVFSSTPGLSHAS